MTKLKYLLEDRIGRLEAGDEVRVIAQYGNHHLQDVKLERLAGGRPHEETTWDELKAKTSILHEDEDAVLAE